MSVPGAAAAAAASVLSDGMSPHASDADPHGGQNHNGEAKDASGNGDGIECEEVVDEPMPSASGDPHQGQQQRGEQVGAGGGEVEYIGCGPIFTRAHHTHRKSLRPAGCALPKGLYPLSSVLKSVPGEAAVADIAVGRWQMAVLLDNSRVCVWRGSTYKWQDVSVLRQYCLTSITMASSPTSEERFVIAGISREGSFHWVSSDSLQKERSMDLSVRPGERAIAKSMDLADVIDGEFVPAMAVLSFAGGDENNPYLFVKGPEAFTRFRNFSSTPLKALCGLSGLYGCVLVADGHVFHWSPDMAPDGQYGRYDNGNVKMAINKLCGSLSAGKVVDVACCGNAFTAVTRDGVIHVWTGAGDTGAKFVINTPIQWTPDFHQMLIDERGIPFASRYLLTNEERPSAQLEAVRKQELETLYGVTVTMQREGDGAGETPKLTISKGADDPIVRLFVCEEWTMGVSRGGRVAGWKNGLLTRGTAIESVSVNLYECLRQLHSSINDPALFANMTTETTLTDLPPASCRIIASPSCFIFAHRHPAPAPAPAQPEADEEMMMMPESSATPGGRPAKRRGRPPGSRGRGAAKRKAEEELATRDTQGGADEPVRPSGRKRGRPRGSGRGRPPKASLAAMAAAAAAAAAAAVARDTLQEQREQKEGKGEGEPPRLSKRGRPRGRPRGSGRGRARGKGRERGTAAAAAGVEDAAMGGEDEEPAVKRGEESDEEEEEEEEPMPPQQRRRGRARTTDEDESEDAEEEEQEWEVERILSHRDLANGVREFQVKWKGAWSPTWESADLLTHCQELLADYWVCRNANKTRGGRFVKDPQLLMDH
ncbi:unnamed protein product [Vitrella brassicaformis CCMP3155]|uniref:Chromo domain-containing protein n=3 Tax=Vitrella brassicaformis TaxID=1169539 RepID=A0A0G4FB96_VITBC|nr:unnamed protein product [Vitrella brassicaformis CCMP3155]|eukprot:CEM10224.1 unnamed protein product [Vitrella brassicaformis CCMP3155]